MIHLSYVPFYGAVGETRTPRKRFLKSLCLHCITTAFYGTEEGIRTPKRPVLSGPCLPNCNHLGVMEPLVALASTTLLYERSVSLSTPQGHSITGSPIIVKHKRFQAALYASRVPSLDWGHGSLPRRNLIIWSGRVDLNHRFLPSEGRGSTRLSYALICLAQNDPVMLIHDHGAPCAFRRGALERVAVLATASSAWKAEAQLLYQTRICHYRGAGDENRTRVTPKTNLAFTGRPNGSSDRRSPCPTSHIATRGDCIKAPISRTC